MTEHRFLSPPRLWDLLLAAAVAAGFYVVVDRLSGVEARAAHNAALIEGRRP